MRKRTPSIVTLLISLAIGAFIGMLVSPAGGEKLRSLILYQLKNLLRMVKTRFKRMVRFHCHAAAGNTAKVASQELVDKTIQKASQLLAEAQALSEQLDSKNKKP